MTEEEFLNIVLQGAGRGCYKEGYESHAQWEIHAQVVISAFLKSGYGIQDVREMIYPGSKEHCDFGFTHNGETYAVEMKVENYDGKFGGLHLTQATISDVNKLHGFNADNLWMLIIARSENAKKGLIEVAERGDSWVIGTESDFMAALCNIKTYPHNLPWMRLDKSTLRSSAM
jgi:hypothetical protein